LAGFQVITHGRIGVITEDVLCGQFVRLVGEAEDKAKRFFADLSQ